MGSKRRKEKKQVILRTRDERQEEIDKIKQKISVMGLTDDLGRITNIFEIMDEYVEQGNPISGSIKLEGYNRVIDYIFPVKKQINLSLNIRFSPN